ncbi:hypothetical protein NP493_606g03033 [Ridgeia piscesae]|uniref:RRM domain-containing protein n=1 Tax=Ridgeia piscesae TaxID=27915 RepID=A0AAD9NQS5_RIDPI|nr:hypothetical protein NP493_606g03033 [Ridgeia piscesae]
MPYLESDLQMPELEYAGDEYDQQGHYHREPVTYLANQYSRRPHLNNRSHLFVSNFPFGTNEMELLQLFAEFGAVYVRIKNSLNVERSTSALITFNSEEERDVAFINAYDTCFKNRPLVVNIAYSSKTPEEEFAMRVQIQPPADDFLPPADDFHENFLVTVPSDIEATSQRHVQKVNTPVNGVSQHAPRRQRAPLLVQTSSYTSQPAPLEADGEIFEEMAALSMHHPSNRMVHMSEPPPLEQY